MLAIAALALAAPAAAHLSLWHPSMYGFHPADKDFGSAATPLNNLPFDKWWFHGYIDQPPAEGWFLDLPAGGTLHAEVSCNKHLTTWGLNWDYHKHACERQNPETDVGMEHTPDPYSTPMDQLRWVKGSALAIAYESDPHKVRPEDFVVVSTNQSSPWFKDVDFRIPAALPACPPGGCHCLWAWNHIPSGGGQEMFATWLRCTVSGQTGSTPLPKPAIARKCPFDKNNCTIGAKQPFYWAQQDGNNIVQDIIDPPYYNHEYGFADGAQTDLWETGCDTFYAQTVMAEPYWMTETAKHAITPATCTPAPTTPPYLQVAPTDVWATKVSSADAKLDTAGPPTATQPMATGAPVPTTTPAPAPSAPSAPANDPSTPPATPADPTFTAAPVKPSDSDTAYTPPFNPGPNPADPNSETEYDDSGTAYTPPIVPGPNDGSNPPAAAPSSGNSGTEYDGSGTAYTPPFVPGPNPPADPVSSLPPAPTTTRARKCRVPRRRRAGKRRLH